MKEKLKEAAATLPQVPGAAAEAYGSQIETLVEQVNAAMAGQPDLEELIGGNPRQVMFQNHFNHARFMANVFRFNQAELLVRMVPWVYHSYHSHGFSFDYFPRELACWMEAISGQIESEAAEPILDVYRWMRAHHALMVEAAQSPEAQRGLDAAELDASGRKLLGALLSGEQREATRLASRAVRRPEDIERLYLEVIQPCLCEVGALWERGEISVAHEHLATAMSLRIMTRIYARLIDVDPHRGLLMVVAAPGEQHDLGARMLADLLELDGWEVDYLGADTPAEDAAGLVSSRSPRILAITVTMPFNLEGAAGMVAKVRERTGRRAPRIMVGGSLFCRQPDLWKVTGADGWAADAREAVRLARQWAAEADLEPGQDSGSPPEK